MKRCLLVLICGVLGLLFLPAQSSAVCPEDPNDNGECDTMYVELFPPDVHPAMFPHLARFPIYVTHDLPDEEIDSIAAFVIPLCFTSANPSASCHLPFEWNNTGGIPGWDQSIFRHLVDGLDTTYNWMLSLAEQLNLKEWDTRILNLVGEGEQTQVFWMSLFPTGQEDQHFWEGSRVLLATMTFRLEDTTTICIDSCFWPPNSRLGFSRMDAASYIPRHFLPVCQRISLLGPPPFFYWCPSDVQHYQNGIYVSSDFSVEDMDGWVVGVNANFVGSGVDNVTVDYWLWPPDQQVEGCVEYQVTDHCQAGGHVQLAAQDDQGNINDWECGFDIVLSNHPPSFLLPSSWTALAGYTMVLKVPAATDQDGDPVTAVELDAFWFEPDSLQPPTNPPTYNPGDPGSFTWVPEEADTGTWICSFSAADVCGAVYTRHVSIQVGMPFCGDCTGEGTVDVSDVVYLIGYLFKAGPAPDPPCKGDVTCDGSVDAGDLVYLINYFFRFGPAPCFECCP